LFARTINQRVYSSMHGLLHFCCDRPFRRIWASNTPVHITLAYLVLASLFLLNLANANPENRNVSIGGNHLMEFKWIEPGSFTMGSKPEELKRDRDEGPVRTVTLSEGFYMGIYEVTQEQFLAVMGYNPSTFQQGEQTETRPVETVSWRESQEFLRRLNLLGSGTFRLPTEAEWEYACRAGTETRFYWGDTEEDWEAYPHAWVNSRSYGTTHPVGTKPPNPWGLHDMSGNVWEWCSDWYGPYTETNETDPAGPKEGQAKVFRGGSYFDFEHSLRSGNRHRHGLDQGYSAIGFRVVWEPDKSVVSDTKTFHLASGLPLELVPIPAGRFLRGSPDSEVGRQKDEGPQHYVDIPDAFYMGRFEITQAQWQRLMGSNPSTFQHTITSANLPVDRVSWEDAQSFIEKLNQRFEGTFSLPTEAEWEYACRAGSSERFPWGEDSNFRELNQHGWFNSRAEGKSHAVGSKQPNDWGLYDMHGNVWEWCQDWFGPYEEETVRNPKGPSEGSHKVIRGGSWFNEPEALRNANRHRHPIDSRQTNLGLRVVWRPW